MAEQHAGLSGAGDRQGRALLDAVATMDRLRGPGGCPWDAEQTHTSLLRYLVEEAYETVDAVEALAALGPDADPTVRAAAEHELAEELGDVLLQVLFHARVAQERAAFDVDDVARLLVDKLVRRHPHVFGDEEHRSGAAVQARWDELKAGEKPSRGPVDGIPRHLPALARADKLLARLERAGLEVPAEAAVAGGGAAGGHGGPGGPGDDAEGQVGRVLLEVVRTARTAGVDPEAALRAQVARLEAFVRSTHPSTGGERPTDASGTGPQGGTPAGH